MWTKVLNVLVVSILALSVGADSFASKRTMVIGALSAPPYVFLDESGAPKGILVAKITLALERVGIQPVFEISNWSRSFHRVKDGTIDAILPALKSSDREQVLAYPQTPVAIFNMVLAKHIRDERQSSNLKTLNGTTVGRIRDARVTPAFDDAAAEKKFILEERATFGQLALGVAHDRLDYAAGPELMLMWGASENGLLGKLEMLNPPLGQGPVYLALSKQSKFVPDLEIIADSLDAVTHSPAFEQALRPYSTFLNVDLYEKLQKAADTHNQNGGP